MFHEEVLETGAVLMREDFGKINQTPSHIGHVAIRAHVLHMQHREASRVLIEITGLVNTGIPDPVKIQLEINQLRICLLEQQLVRYVAIDRSELEIVIVIGHFKAGTARGLACVIEGFDEPFKVAKRAFIGLQEGDHDIALPDCERRFDHGIEIITHGRELNVGGRRGEPVAVEDRANLGGSAIEVSGELHLLVTERGYSSQCALEILRQFIAQRIQLQAWACDLPALGQAVPQRRTGSRQKDGMAQKRAPGQWFRTEIAEYSRSGQVLPLFFLLLLVAACCCLMLLVLDGPLAQRLPHPTGPGRGNSGLNEAYTFHAIANSRN